MVYGEFAGVYDELMNDYDYDLWSDYYLSEIRRRLGRTAFSLAECACGTGNLTVRFAREGCTTLGIDASAAMLRVAEEKARDYGVSVQLIRQDMRKLTLPRPMDAVLCTCDGLNYLTSGEDVRAFFTAAGNALKPGGVLAFDLSSRYKLETLIGDSFLGEERDGIAYLWKNKLDAEKHIVMMDMTFFVREEDGRYRRFREEHRQRAHSLDEIMQWLEACGFRAEAVYGEWRLDAPRREDTRIHVFAKKDRRNR